MIEIYITCLLQILSFSSRFRRFKMKNFLRRPSMVADNITWLIVPSEFFSFLRACNETTSMKHTIYKFLFSRHKKYFTFFIFILKTITITTNNPMLFQYFLRLKLHRFCHFLLKNFMLYQKLHIYHQKKF